MGSGVARRYARALFDLARDRGILEETGRDLSLVVETVRRHEELRQVLHNPLVPVETKQEVFAASLGGRVGRPVAELVRLVLRKGRETFLPQILAEFEALVRRELNVVRAEVTVARPLSDQLRGQLERRLEELWGRKVELDLRVSPDVIGGLVLTVGDRRMDGSLRGRLESLRRMLSGRETGAAGGGPARRDRFGEG